MADNELDRLAEQVAPKRDFDPPPLHLWDPPLSGDIPIRIEPDGSWYHDGGLIKRDSLVRLFASILRREQDGEYYLVSPVEKWRIEVALHPLLVVDVDRVGEGDDTVLLATLNTGSRVAIGEHNRLFLETALDSVAALTLPHGLSALFTRAAWYRLVDMAEGEGGECTVSSGGVSFDLGAAQ
ncbi:MAG: DUF1285 domain-containing protein [Halioglobus sp.]|nr:DUF1285 domain-containing protein [Halioglobus sp.]